MQDLATAKREQEQNLLLVGQKLKEVKTGSRIRKRVTS